MKERVKVILSSESFLMQNIINEYIDSNNLDIDYLEFQYQLGQKADGKPLYTCMIINRKEDLTA